MITEVYIEGKRLDLYDDENITVKQVSKDLKDISKIFADFSQSFTVPASANNNNIFKHYYNANIDGGYDARTRKSANIVVGGLDFKQGKMRLDSVEIINNVPANYKITFFGNVISVKDRIGDDKLFDLEFLSNFDHDYSGAQVKTGLTSGLSFTVDGTLYTRAIVYPLISYRKRYIYNSSGSDHTNTDTLVNIAHHSGHSSGNEHGVDYRDLKPAIRLSVIIEAIQRQYNLNFNSPFFDSDTFKRIYMNLNKSTETLANGLLVVEDLSGTVAQPANNVPLRWRYRLDVTPKAGFENTRYKKRLTFNGQVIYEDTNWVTGTTAREQNTEIDLDSNDYEVKAEVITEGNFEFDADTLLRKQYLGSTITVFDNNYLDLAILVRTRILDQLSDIKVFDFLTGIFKTFNLVAYAENDEIVIKDLQSYYSEGRIFDVTEFIETKKETVKRGEFFKEIDFKFQESKQVLADEFKQSNNQGYGDLDFVLSDENGNPLQDVDGETLEVKSVFENPIFERLNDLDDNSQTPIQYCLYTDREINPIVGKPFLFFLFQNVSLVNYPIGFIDENGESEINTSVLMPSHSEFTTNSFNLNFNAEISEYTGSVMQDTIYNRYWSDYIGDMFSIKRRNYNMEAILPVNLLNNLRLSDRLIIKGNRYIINSISSNIVDRRDTLELINDIYDAPLASDSLNTSFFRQTLQTFDNGAQAYSFTYIGLANKTIELVDLGDGTGHVKLNDTTTTSNVFEVGYTLSANSTGNEFTVGIRVVDDINNPLHVIIQEA